MEHSTHETVPELYSNPKNITLKPGEIIMPVHVEITPDGGYNGNGEFEICDEGNFRIIEFDRRNGREVWTGRGWTRVSTNSGIY